MAVFFFFPRFVQNAQQKTPINRSNSERLRNYGHMTTRPSTTATTMMMTTMMREESNQLIQDYLSQSDEARRTLVETKLVKDGRYFAFSIDSKHLGDMIDFEVRQFDNPDDDEAIKQQRALDNIQKDREFVQTFIDNFCTRVTTHPLFKVIALEQVLKHGKDNAKTDYSAYEDVQKQEDSARKTYDQAVKDIQKLATTTGKDSKKDTTQQTVTVVDIDARIAQEDEKLKLKLRELSRKRSMLLGKMYRLYYEHLLGVIVSEREKEKKERAEREKAEELRLQKEKTEKATKKPASRGASRNSDRARSATPSVANSETMDNRTDVFFLLRDYPRSLEETECLLMETDFDAFFLINKESLRGPPASYFSEDRKAKKPTEDKKKPPKAAQPPAKKTDKKKDDVAIERLPPRLYSMIQDAKIDICKSNLSSRLRNILFMEHTVYEFEYDDQNQKFNDGSDLDIEVNRLVALFTTNVTWAQTMLEKENASKVTSKFVPNSQHFSNVDTLYKELLKDIPDESITISIVLHCIVEQLVRNVEEVTSVNRDDKKLIEFTGNASQIFDTIFSKFDDSTNFGGDESNTKDPVTRIGHNMLIPYSNVRTSHFINPLSIQNQKLADIESKYSKMVPAFSASLGRSEHEPLLPGVDTLESRGVRHTEQYYFATRSMVHKPLPEIVSKELLMIKFEEMMNKGKTDGHTHNLRFVNFREDFDSETFVQVLKDVCLFNSYEQLSEYYDVEDSVLLSFNLQVPETLYREFSQVNNFSVLPYPMERLQVDQNQLTTKTRIEYLQAHHETLLKIEKLTKRGFDEEQSTSEEQPTKDITPTEGEDQSHPTVRSRQTAKSNQLEHYVFEREGASLIQDRIDFYPLDGAIVHFSSTCSIQRTVTCSIEKDDCIFSLKSSGSIPPLFTVNFKDDSTLFVRKIDNKTELSLGTIDGLYTQLLSDGTVFQVYPNRIKEKKSTFGSGFHGLYINKEENMSVKVHFEEQPLLMYDDQTRALVFRLCREQSRVITMSGEIHITYDDDIIQILLPNGETHVKNAAGTWLRTNILGKRIIEGADGTKEMDPINASQNVEPEFQAKVFSREDLVMKIEYPSLTSLVLFPDGTRIWKYFENRSESQTNMCQQQENNTILIEQMQYATVRIDELENEKVIHTELPDGTLLSHKPETSKNIRLVREGHEILLDESNSSISIEPRSLLLSEKRKSRLNPKYYFGTYFFDYSKARVKVIDSIGNEFMFSGDGRSMVRYYSEVERKRNRASDVFFDTLDDRKNEELLGLAPVLKEGEPFIKQQQIGGYFPPRLFTLNISENKSSEYLVERSVSTFMRMSEEDANTNVQTDYYDEAKSMATHTFLTKYGSNKMKRLLSQEVRKYQMPRSVKRIDLSRNPEKLNILRSRKLVQYPILSESDRQLIVSGLDAWVKWTEERVRRERTLTSAIPERTEEELRIENEIQERLVQLASRLAGESNDDSSSESDSSVIRHEQPTETDVDEIDSIEKQVSPPPPESHQPNIAYGSPPKIERPITVPPRPIYWNLPKVRAMNITSNTPVPPVSSSSAEEPPAADKPHQSPTNTDVDSTATANETLPIEDVESFPVQQVAHDDERGAQEEEAENGDSTTRVENTADETAHSMNIVTTKHIEPGKPRRVILKKLFATPAAAVPNYNQYPNNTRTLKTVSINQTKIAQGKNLKEPAPKNGASPDAPLLKVYPSSISFGNIMVGEVYRCAAMLTNAGHLPGRFFIKHFNKSTWTSAYVKQEVEPPAENILRVLCQSGPLAPGISVKIEFEIHAFRPQKMNQTVEIRTEQHIIYLPVQANVVSQEEFTKQKYTLHSRVKIVQLSP